MAEMIGLSQACQRPQGATAGFFAALKRGLFRLLPGQRGTRLQFEEWPDYLLRDIGMDRTSIEPAKPWSTDWMRR